MTEIRERKEIGSEYKWDLKAIYKSEQEINEDIKKVEKMIGEIPKYEAKMLENGKELYTVTKCIYDASRIVQKLYTYASLKYNEDISNTNSIEGLDRIYNLNLKLEQASSFYNSKLMTISYDSVKKMYEEYPALKDYDKAFERLFRYKKYMLSESEEKLLVNLAKAFSDTETIFSNLTDSDIDFGTIIDEEGKTVTLTNTNYRKYVESKNRNVRKSTFQTLYSVYKRYKTTLTSCLDSHVKKTATLNKIRKYKSTLFSEMYDDELDEKVFEAVITSVSNGLEPLFKYYKLKKEILGLDELHIYDIYTSVIDKYDKKYNLEEARDLIKKALHVFGDEYLSYIDKAFDEKWIDFYPNKGKTGGAFSGGCYDTYPYILTNFQESFDDVSTLIHELGHSMHSYYSRKNNPYITSNYTIVVAEVASTVNELLLARYVIDHTDSIEEKLYILDMLMNTFKGTIYRQTMYEEFEKFLYDRVENDEALTSDILCDKFYELNKKYFGPDVVIDEEIRYEWERMPHLYYNFYMYKYASGLSSACYIVDSILSGKKDAVKNYIEFLKQGSRIAPNDELKITGVDLTKKELYDNAIKTFGNIVDEFEKTYNEYKRSGGVNE